MQTEKIVLPEWLMNTSYNGRIIPNGKTHDIASTGANCQVFAYQLLRHYDLVVPDFRSSELWEDVEFSEIIQENYEPLDVLFFSPTKEAYGAHIAVCIGEGQAVHLSKSVGKPIVWEIATFLQYPKYRVLLGGKRFLKQ